MRHNGLGKLYDRLTPEERFRLDVLAMARGDVEESEFANPYLSEAWVRYERVGL